MSNRHKAAEVLKRVFDKTADKLCDLILDSGEELSEGDYCIGEFAELAEKLRVFSVTLAILPVPQQAPQGETTIVIQANRVITIKDFLNAIAAGEMEAATKLLSHIFQITHERADKCVIHYADRLKHYGQTTNKTIQLETETDDPTAITLLATLFGLGPNECEAVLHVLRTSNK